MHIYFYSSFFQIFMTIFVRDTYSCACDLDLYISGYIQTQTLIRYRFYKMTQRLL